MPPRELFEPPLDQIVLRNRPPDPLPAGLHLEIDPTGIDATPLYLDTFVQRPRRRMERSPPRFTE